MHAPVLVTPADTDGVVTVDELKAHLRVDGSDEDVLIELLRDGAVAHLDGYSGVLGRAIATQTWRQDFDAFDGDTLRLPLPAASIASVKVRDSAGQLATVSSSSYLLQEDALGSLVRFDDDYTYPSDLADTKAIAVEFAAGYDAVPSAIKVAVLLLVGHWYANRETVVTGTIATELPLAVAALIAPYRRVGI